MPIVDPEDKASAVEGPEGSLVSREPAVARASALAATPISAAEERLSVVEERLAVSKRRVVAGTVRVATHTDFHEAVAEIDLDRYRVEVERVPVDRVVDAIPPARTEGETTIVSVVEERFVVVKQLVVIEELHIRHVLARETLQETVPLRRQRATVERRDAVGQPVPESE